MSPEFKRKKYPVVFRGRQYRMLALVLFYSFTLVMIFLFLFLPDFFLMQDETASLELRGHAADRILMLHARLWPAIIAALCLIGLHSFRMVLFFIGPLKRLRWAFDKMRVGDLAFRVVLRKGDLLMEETEGLNLTIDTLAERVHRVKAAVDTVQSALQVLDAELQTLLPQDARSRIEAPLEAIRGGLNHLQRSTDYFKTRGDADAAL